MDRQTVAVQYSTGANLAARIALHQRCSTNPYGFQRWVFDRLDLQSGRRVLEIACGTGSLWRENLDRMPPDVALTLTDLSLTMIQTTMQTTAKVVEARFVACALPELPFADAAFDLVIANHMLYHVADRQRGLADIERVLRPGGVLFATTNGIGHLRELKELMRDFDVDGSDVSASFTLENAEAQLRPLFPNLERADYLDSLRVADPSLILAYVASMNARAAEVVGERGDDMRAVIEARIGREGAFHVMKATGAFVGRK